MANKLDRSFRDIERAFRTKEFYTLFFNKMKEDLTKYYGEDEALKILGLLGKKKLRVVNPQIFFDSDACCMDPAPRVFLKSKTATEFVRNYIIAIRQMQSLRLTKLDLPLFFMALCQYRTDITTSLMERLAEELFTMLATPKGLESTTITLQVLDSKLYCAASKILPNQILNIYFFMTNKFITGCLKAMKNPAYKDFNFPKIELLNSIYKDDRNQVELYLRDIFMTKLQIIKDTTKEVKTFTEDSSELRSAISILKSLKEGYFFDEEAIVKEVINISNTRPYKVYPLTLELNKKVRHMNFNEYYKNSEHTFIALDTCEYIGLPILCEIEIDCKKMTSFEDIENLITAAARILLLKNRIQETFKEAKMLITLTDVGVFSPSLVDTIKKTQKLLNSQYNKEFFVGIKFVDSFAKNTFSDEHIKYIRVISDIHCDVNEGRGYTFDFGDDYVINCGDTASTCTDAASWIVGNMRQGIVVIGNHLGYDYPFPELGVLNKKNSRTWQAKKLNNLLIPHNSVRVLGAQNPFIFEGITFVGGTLYSDLLLYGEENFQLCKNTAAKGINDFKRCYVTHFNEVAPYTIDDHLRYFSYNKRDIGVEIRRVRTGPVVVITHFAPLPYSVAPEYNGDPLSAYFVSDMREFLKEFPKVRLWCHGHTHAKFDYIYRRKDKKGKWCETRVVCNPFGYYNENNAKLPDGYGTRIKVSDIKSKTDWTVLLATDIKKGKVKVYTDEE